MIVDSFWIILSQKALHKAPLGWLSTNLAFTTALFLIIYLNLNLESSAIFLVIVCLARTIIDYIGFTDVYFPKKDLNQRI